MKSAAGQNYEKKNNDSRSDDNKIRGKRKSKSAGVIGKKSEFKKFWDNKKIPHRRRGDFLQSNNFEIPVQQKKSDNREEEKFIFHF